VVYCAHPIFFSPSYARVCIYARVPYVEVDAEVRTILQVCASCCYNMQTLCAAAVAAVAVLLYVRTSPFKSKYSAAWITAPAAEAESLAEKIVGAHLAACVNILPGIKR
jgi:hypothetical protein